MGIPFDIYGSTSGPVDGDILKRFVNILKCVVKQWEHVTLANVTLPEIKYGQQNIYVLLKFINLPKHKA